MKIRRVMLAAPKSGSGKTMLTCALLQTLKDRGEQVISYKCGPDYIDPMFHKKVIDIPSKNLDTFFTNEEQTKRRFLSGRTESEIAVLEGCGGSSFVWFTCGKRGRADYYQAGKQRKSKSNV